ncbi:trypsin-like peptidase domain-containing protein [Roseivivax isoporae]|uniref:Peptidoglycan-binding protein n=1 Tax=Roseivivax isoporae LMG 25204 TaxID=1449351 RepID=X7FAB1_9RHOB|nr:trypsin-like peptidase domain-containing protein [Roseivivax isoporae]ETX29755.1 peptidoglycan-binding protein [Roseivivax isoporae LMG 25204]
MKTRVLGAVVALVWAGAAMAQDAWFVQIEAQPTLGRAEERVRDYSSYLQDVNGFDLGSGWYGIALGPYSRAEAEARLSGLRANGQIPRDSYIEDEDRYRQRFFPVGAAALPGVADDQADGDTPAALPEPEAPPAPVDESPREARATEALLTPDERAELQVALQWAGFYDGAIDAAFGAGTRNSMADWQRANNVEVTGVLTTRQRATLLGQYNAVLEGMGLERVTDRRAGVTIEIPTGVVAFEKAESPFVHYAPTGEIDARVLLISQPGDARTLGGLYEIMQTLESVPLEGPRERTRDGFTLTGANDRIVSHTEARLSDGAIKGFTLIWPAGDEERRTRILAAMQDSFSPVPGVVLDPATVSESGQAVDLMAGLRIRQPIVTASGFYVDRAGTVITALDAVEGCGRITLDEAHEAQVVARDAELGAAVLRPVDRLAPLEVASFRLDPPRLQSEIAVSGYPFGGVLSAPTLTYGTLEDVRGLGGETTLKRLALAAEPGDAGGPVLDAGGGVVGMLLPRESAARQLPDQVSFAAKAEALQALVAEAGVSAGEVQGAAAMAPEDLTAIAAGMTVLVSCWE